MVKLIMGIKGTGKTKQLAELVNKAAADEREGVVCMEYGPNMMFEIDHSARLVDVTAYDIHSIKFLKGFFSGLVAGNYDITQIFVDNLLKVAPELKADGIDYAAIDSLLEWLDKFSTENNVKFTVTLSDAEENATETMRKFF